jgi:plastocyanin
MKRSALFLSAAVLVAASLSLAAGIASPPVQTGGGTIKGHVRLMGKLPGNSVIRMGLDPKCNEMNKGKQVVQETVKATIDGSLANVLVRLEGKFPASAVPKTPVVIDQQHCIYSPRVVGVRVGQFLEVRNSDNLAHNVHSNSNLDNAFNVSQAKAGVVNTFKMKSEEVFRLGCDIHHWMMAYVGVVSNPYFAVTDASGNFQITNVPAGTYTIVGWHERYGPVKKTVKVTAGGTVTVDFSYTGNEPKPSVRNIEESGARIPSRA